MPKSPMTATMKSKPFISSVIPKVSRSWPVTMSSPAAARMKPIRIDTSDLIGLPPPSPMNEEKVRSWIAKNSGGPNLSAISASSGANSVISTTEKSAPTNEEVKAAVSASPPAPAAPSGSRRRWWPPTRARPGC